MKTYGLGFYSIGREGFKQKINVMSFYSPTKSFLKGQSNVSKVGGTEWWWGDWQTWLLKDCKLRWSGSNVLAGSTPPLLLRVIYLFFLQVSK